MVETKIGGRPVDITKEGDKIKVVFHPLALGVKHPKANIFTVKLAKSDLKILEKVSIIY